MNQEHPLHEVGFKKGEELEVKWPAFLDCGESKGVPEKNLLLLH